MLALVGAAEELPVEQLDPDHGKDELQQCNNDDDEGDDVELV